MAYRDELAIAAVNFHAAWGEKAANCERILGLAREAAGQGADMVLFPETALTGYNHDGGSIAMHQRDAEPRGGPSATRLVDCARELGIWLVVGLPERDEASGRLYNSALVTGPDGLVDCYRKIHPAKDELLWAAKGDRPCLFATPWGPVGLGICYDTYLFPEVPRHLAAMGARLYLNPTAVSARPGWADFYYTMLRVRGVENGLFIASANLVGEDRDMTFPGGSLVLGPGDGPIDTRYHGAPVEGREAIVLARIDLAQSDRVRAQLPILRENPLTGEPDWRPSIYAGLLDTVLEQEDWRHGM
ncbi:carbon-nitrogen hydrolase family protein [Novosphingobium bradum]|uniref:Carbon-nitrogen hydrolase family protein n=1 Tax=Novosphingobium bradum TaxID=1737444 RepID=A0ABV7IMM9_9SPHN